jgi:hypothetical protein
MVFKLPTARRREGVDGGQAEGGLVKETGKMREIDGCQFLYIYINYLCDFFRLALRHLQHCVIEWRAG